MIGPVVYLVGWGRSGSTLLTAVLGELEGSFAAGELRMLWQLGVIEERLCGCGEPIPRCPVWSGVIAALDGAPCSAEEMADIQARRLRSRHWAGELGRLLLRRRPDAELQRYVETYARALRATAEVTGSEVVIDSSKHPIDALLLEQAGISLRPVHLVRDPRTVAASWSRRKELRDGEDNALKVFSPWSSSLLWSLWNATGELVGRRRGGRRTIVRYEDFLHDPRGVVDRVAHLADLSLSGLQLEDRTALLPTNHQVAGNADKFVIGAVRIEEREGDQLGWWDALLSSIASFPLTLRYGYRALPRRSRA